VRVVVVLSDAIVVVVLLVAGDGEEYCHPIQRGLLLGVGWVGGWWWW